MMSWCIGLNQFVSNTELFKRVLKESVFRIFGIGQSVCKLTTVVRLDTLNRIRKPLYTVLNEQR